MREMAAWYQKKIGTYDKQEWETTIEQRILHGLAHVPFKSAKLRPDLIDVDLVRGSSFPKAKPVQGLGTVVRLALARVFFFPLWSHWWGAHTSASASRFLFVLWGLQLLNTILYVVAPSTVRLDGLSIVVPFCLMAGLGVVHALIVSTSPPRPYDHRYRSLSNEERRPRLRVSTTPDIGILRQKTSISSDDAINSSSIKPKNNRKLPPTASVATQTKNNESGDHIVDETCTEWLGNHPIPTVSLTPPPSVQSVSFDLGGLPDGETSKDELQNSPVNRKRRRRINVRNANPEGDDGFESLNGNNSNDSDNGEESIPAEEEDDELKDSEDETDSDGKIGDENKINIQNDKNVNDILYNSKLTKRLRKTVDHDVCVDDEACSKRKSSECCQWSDDVHVLEEVSVGSGSTVRFREGLRVRVGSDGGSSTNLSEEQLRGRERRCKTGVRFRNSWVQEFLEQRNPMAETAARKTRKSCQSSSSEEECDTASASLGVQSQHTDWVGQTTNSEECSYSSGHEESEWEGRFEDPAWEPCAILSPASDRVSCTIWERGRVMKAYLSAVDISRAVVRRAEGTLARTSDGLWPGTLVATLLAALAPAAKLLQILIESEAAGSEQVTIWDLPGLFFFNSPLYLVYLAFGSTIWERVINVISAILRLGLGALVFFLLAVAERAFRQRFLYAKLFSHLTSARRARQSSLPHFRLNRVRNIKTWLSVRSYLKRRGPQRSVDVIVSAAFFMMVLLISYLVIQLLNESGQTDCSRAAEAFGWVLSLGLVLLRLAALGTRAARKHRCLPVLLTEQINLHLAMERRPAGKDRLVVANNVLKLAADLLKELERPFKISGLSANPYLYTITKVVILSALSGVLSEILGFKLKLHKIKIK